MSIRAVACVLAAASVALTGCQSQPASESQTSQAPAASAADASHDGHTGRRVFFVEPKNGATVKSPVKFVFGSDELTIAPVPEGDVVQVRPGTGHFHLGVDTDCLPAGEIIPKAQPWIHFGTGNNTIDMQLTPGTHKFAVQAGDDQHRTMPNLCETMSITVTE